jgi:hypothetical protein
MAHENFVSPLFLRIDDDAKGLTQNKIVVGVLAVKTYVMRLKSWKRGTNFCLDGGQQITQI